MLNILKVTTQLLLLILLIFVAISGIAVVNIQKQSEANKISLEVLEKTIRQDYDEYIKSQVNNVISLLDGINKKYNRFPGNSQGVRFQLFRAPHLLLQETVRHNPDPSARGEPHQKTIVTL